MTVLAERADLAATAAGGAVPASSPRPLSGVRVVECAMYIAAPSGGMALGRLGADVIRVDPVGGAPDRGRWPLAPSGASLYWANLNQGKRSVVLDLSSERGRELFGALVTAPGPDAGVLLHNRGGRSWLDDAALRARREDLVHVSVEGLRDGTPALDYTVNARVGIPFFTGVGGDRQVVNHVLPAWDLLCGATASTALLAALRHRDRTGEGTHARISLEDVATAAVADLGWLADAQLSGRDRARDGSHLYGTYGDVMTTRDGQPVMVIAMTHRQWAALQAATGTTEAFAALAANLGLDLATETGRYENRVLVSAVLQRWFSDHERDTALGALAGTGALHSAYGTLTELAAHLATGDDAVVAPVTHPGVPSTLAAGSPVRWDGETATPTPAPRLGEHTAEVLQEVLGLTTAEVGALERDHVVGVAA